MLRHGESTGNADGAFAGWRDAPLTARGREQARAAAGPLALLLPHVDVVFTSRLSRAIETATLVLQARGAGAVERHADWRLNERHCGALQGRSKDDCRRDLGRDGLRALRRDWQMRPPLAAAGGPDDPRHDPRYADLPGPLPRGESLADLAARLAPCWTDVLRPRLQAGQQVLVVGHGVALRVLARPLEGIADERLPEWLLGNAGACAWTLDRELRVLAVDRTDGGDVDGD